MIRLKQPSTILDLALENDLPPKPWSLYNSPHDLSLLPDKSPMTIFRALKKLMLRIRSKIDKIKFKRAIKVDELYVNA